MMLADASMMVLADGSWEGGIEASSLGIAWHRERGPNDHPIELG